MKRILYSAFAAMVLLLVSSLPGYAAHGHFRGGVWIGPGLWGPWWGAPYYSAPYYPYYAPPPVIVQEHQPEIYVQPAPQSDAPVYWYFCRDPEGYYPYVTQCPKGWLKVVPSPPSGDRKE